jgi:membrane protein implicated in regulation of membrane protease activity
MPSRSTRRSPVLARYLLYQIPGWILVGSVLVVMVRGWDLSTPAALLLFAIWLAKDLALYPLLRRSYAGSHPGGVEHLIGALGTVRARLAPDGYVRIGAELWRAEVSHEHAPVEAGSTVRVRSVRGLTLEVEPE